MLWLRSNWSPEMTPSGVISYRRVNGSCALPRALRIAHTAGRGSRTTQVTDIATDMRWPRWAAGTRDLHLGSVLAGRLWTSQSTLGASNFYASAPPWFDTDALLVAEVLGRHASIALSSARQEESLQRAIVPRTLVGQAQGIIVERFDLDRESAFEVLRRHSQNANLKLNEVARILVNSRALPSTDDQNLRLPE